MDHAAASSSSSSSSSSSLENNRIAGIMNITTAMKANGSYTSGTRKNALLPYCSTNAQHVAITPVTTTSHTKISSCKQQDQGLNCLCSSSQIVTKGSKEHQQDDEMIDNNEMYIRRSYNKTYPEDETNTHNNNTQHDEIISSCLSDEMSLFAQENHQEEEEEEEEEHSKKKCSDWDYDLHWNFGKFEEKEKETSHNDRAKRSSPPSFTIRQRSKSTPMAICSTTSSVITTMSPSSLRVPMRDRAKPYRRKHHHHYNEQEDGCASSVNDDSSCDVYSHAGSSSSSGAQQKRKKQAAARLLGGVIMLEEGGDGRSPSPPSSPLRADTSASSYSSCNNSYSSSIGSNHVTLPNTSSSTNNPDSSNTSTVNNNGILASLDSGMVVLSRWMMMRKDNQKNSKNDNNTHESTAAYPSSLEFSMYNYDPTNMILGEQEKFSLSAAGSGAQVTNPYEEELELQNRRNGNSRDYTRRSGTRSSLFDTNTVTSSQRLLQQQCGGPQSLDCSNSLTNRRRRLRFRNNHNHSPISETVTTNFDSSLVIKDYNPISPPDLLIPTHEEMELGIDNELNNMNNNNNSGRVGTASGSRRRNIPLSLSIRRNRVRKHGELVQEGERSSTSENSFRQQPYQAARSVPSLAPATANYDFFSSEEDPSLISPNVAVRACRSNSEPNPINFSRYFSPRSLFADDSSGDTQRRSRRASALGAVIHSRAGSSQRVVNTIDGVGAVPDYVVTASTITNLSSPPVIITSTTNTNAASSTSLATTVTLVRNEYPLTDHALPPVSSPNGSNNNINNSNSENITTNNNLLLSDDDQQNQNSQQMIPSQNQGNVQIIVTPSASLILTPTPNPSVPTSSQPTDHTSIAETTTLPPSNDSNNRVREARISWIRINQRLHMVITLVALMFSLLVFAILVCWVVLTSAYVVSLDKKCDIPLKSYFWLASLQLILDVFRTDIMRIVFGYNAGVRQRVPIRVLIYNVAYLTYAMLILRMGIRSVFFSKGSTCPETAPELFQTSTVFVSLFLAAWSTIVIGYIVPICLVLFLLTRQGYPASLVGGSGGGMNVNAAGPGGFFPTDYVGRAGVGADPEVIEMLRVVLFEEFPDEYPKECCICMADFVPGEIIIATECEHVFHKSCCEEWLRQARTCPVCRTDIPDSLNWGNNSMPTPTSSNTTITEEHVGRIDQEEDANISLQGTTGIAMHIINASNNNNEIGGNNDNHDLVVVTPDTANNAEELPQRSHFLRGRNTILESTLQERILRLLRQQRHNASNDSTSTIAQDNSNSNNNHAAPEGSITNTPCRNEIHDGDSRVNAAAMMVVPLGTEDATSANHIFIRNRNPGIMSDRDETTRPTSSVAIAIPSSLASESAASI